MPSEIHDIEQEIEIERGLLSRAIGQLREAVSLDGVKGTIPSAVRDKSGPFGRIAMDTARANPAGAVLLGVGIAALLAGPKRPAGPKQNDGCRRADVVDETQNSEFDCRLEAADADQVSNAKPNANRMKAALNTGLANLPEPARRKVIKAREAAISVQEKIDERAVYAAREAKRLHNTQPLMAAALAAGVGAMIGVVLPRTRVKDESLGAKRDVLLQQAELALHDEIARLADIRHTAPQGGAEANS